MTTSPSHDNLIDSLKLLDVFTLFTEEKLEPLIKDCEETTLGSGEILFREGEAGDSMYLIMSGELSIEYGMTRVAKRNPGDYFGEMSLIDDQPRSATVTAIKKSRLLKISKDQFNLHFVSDPQVVKEVLKTVTKLARENLNFASQWLRSLQNQKKINANLQRLLDDTSNEFYIYNSSSLKLLCMNSRARENLGYDIRESNYITLFDIIGNLNKDKFKALVEPLQLNKKDKVSFKGINRRKDGSEYSLEYTFKFLKGEASTFLIGIAQDTSKLTKIEEKFTELAFYDSLTGLPNKNLILDNLNSEILQADGTKSSVAVLLINLNDFQTVNDSLGHQAGDNVLKAVAKRLQKWSTSIYPIGKLVGDEFIIILSGINFESEAARAPSTLLNMFQSPFSVSGQQIYISINIGISYYPTDGNDGGNLIDHAETAMFYAKAKGRNTYCRFNSDIELEAANKLFLERDLRKALELDQFILYYQPKFEFFSESIVGFEALVRWNHPTKGLVSPIDFIPLAEETLLINPLGEWILRTACKQIKIWRDMGLLVKSVSVNLSAHQFNHPNFSNKIKEIILEEDVYPEYLELEIANTNLMENSEMVASQLKTINGIGVKITVDDFGTGFASLNNLKIFPVNYLMIEQVFVKDISSEEGTSLAKGIITLAKSMDLKTIAKGVETEEQKEVLKSIGCDVMQGYLFSKPLPADEATKLLSSAK